MNSDIMELKHLVEQRRQEKDRADGALERIKKQMSEKGFSDIEDLKAEINKKTILLERLETSIEKKVVELKSLLNNME